MSSLPKLAVLSLVVIAIGGLQFAVPAFTSKHITPPISHVLRAQKEQSNRALINQPTNDFQHAQSGTLYLIHEQSELGETVQKHLLSPTLKTEVDIKVTGIIARTKLTQTFKNAGKHWVNALYVFPLPENAAVDHLLMTVGERKIEGQIKSKSIAKEIYLQAKAAGKKASLVVQQRPNMFSNSIANIGPGETIKISIEYQQTLHFDQQQYSLRFPMTITPRYLPGDSTEESHIQTAFSQNPNSQKNSNIELNINLHAGFEVQDIKSEFHPITIKKNAEGGHHIQLSKGNVADQDFVLNWRPELGAAPQSAHFTQQVNGDEYGLVMLLPPVIDEQITQTQQREVIFVLDTSGSMEGDSIKQAKKALLLAITQLKATDNFNVIEFNSYAQNLWESPKFADQNNKQEAKHFVNSLSANGGTEIRSALKLAFSQPKTGASTTLRQIVFITDGSVGNEASLMQLISNKLANSRLFTVGIGSAPNSYFMSEAAKMGRGTFTHIGSVDQVQEKMLTLLTKLQHPAITDIELQINANTLQSNRQLEFYPNVISDVYKDEPMVLSYRLTGDEMESNSTNNPGHFLSKIKLWARYQEKPWENALTPNAQTRQSGLNVLWAREKISQLTRDKRLASMRINSSAAEQDEYKSQITETALAHHLISQYTSLVAVDVTPTRPFDIRSKNQKVTNPLPKGTSNHLLQSHGSLPKTATSAQLKILIGLILIGLAICMHLLTKRK
ncbi:MAG TPA: marine proteobacterial sortase target protein, partial [Glaciecola sp.]|nr:marine proteobacterial sortase target protein [Glaciecola sp.]